MKKKPQQSYKEVKGYVYNEFMKLGWRGRDGGVIVYRYAMKSEKEKDMLPVTISFNIPTPKNIK